MMKANNQLGFININEDSIDKIIKDDEVIFERGFLREKTSTTLPITFGGIGKDLKDYKVYGNTVQNGTPTPNTPIDMVSCGDKTKNLLNYSLETEPYYYDENGNKSSTATSMLINQKIKVLSNTDYKFTFDSISTGNNVYLRFVEFDENDNFLTRTLMNTNGVIITTQPNTSYVILSIDKHKNKHFENPMVQQGPLYVSYEPYGYKIPVNVRSDNLFDVNWYFDNCVTHNCSKELIGNSIKISFTAGADAYIGETRNSNVGTTTATQNIAIKVKENTQYTFIASSLPRCYITYMDKNYDILNSSYIRFDSSYTKSSYTFTTPENCKYVAFRMGIQDNEYTEWTFGDIQLVEGSTAPSKYIPYYNETTNIYLDEPLRKIGEYSDYIDFINGKVVRKIYEYKITGDEAWGKTYGDNLFNIDRMFNNKPFIVGYGLSNMYKYNPVQSGINANTVNGEFALQKSVASGGAVAYNLFIKNTSYSDKDLFKTYLQNLYNNNTPVVINYPLETSTEESITLPNIPTVEGNNTLNIETEITPSQVYIKYKSNT